MAQAAGVQANTVTYTALVDGYMKKQNLAKERRERSVIRTKSIDRHQQGTLEEMDAVASCIEKGCLVDPMKMEDMYVETRVQPISKLQERLRLGDTNRNETAR